jgi:hypothetical protein
MKSAGRWRRFRNTCAKCGQGGGYWAARGKTVFGSLNAYEIDHWVAARAQHARILWLRGYPDDAKREAELCISEALQLGHTQSTCWALAFNIIPVAVWRGDLVEARQFTNVLRERSQEAFQHYHEWAQLYDRFLDRVASPPDQRK